MPPLPRLMRTEARVGRPIGVRSVKSAFVFRLDRGPAGRSALRTDVLVLVALGQDEQQALAHLHPAIAFGTGEQTRLKALECRSLISRHSV